MTVTFVGRAPVPEKCYGHIYYPTLILKYLRVIMLTE